MELKLEWNSVLMGRILGGVVILLAVVSAIVGATSARSGGFDLFLWRLTPPLAIGLLIIAVTEALKGIRSGRARRQGRPPAVPSLGTVPTAQAGEAARIAAQWGLGALRGGLRLNPGSVGASVAGVMAVVSLFLPWVAWIVSAGGESEVAQSYTLLGMAGDVDDGALIRVLFFIMLLLGLVGSASVVLHRAVGIIVGIAGTVMTPLTYVYLFAAFSESNDFISVFPIPHIGFVLTGGCFLLIAILRIIPRLNRSGSRGLDGDNS